MALSLSQFLNQSPRPNIILIMTDQQRAEAHWVQGFIEQYLPSLHRLQQHGMTFRNAFTGACMCSPSRATFLTSQYPFVTGVTHTGSPEPKPLPLPSVMPNLATIMEKAGYTQRIWWGKWHAGIPDPTDPTKNSTATPEPSSLVQYGFTQWDPPDSGNSQKVDAAGLQSLGGGVGGNDTRYGGDAVATLAGTEPSGSSLQDINTNEPFFLVASFVNPHDIYVAQQPGLVPTSGTGQGKSGYYYSNSQTVVATTTLPPDADGASLGSAARIHAQSMFQAPSSTNDVLSQLDYINFYAYLQTLVDQQIASFLQELDQLNLIKNTLIIRFADHGEMAASHNLVEKSWNAYEETIRIPLVFSNPQVWPAPAPGQNAASTEQIVSLVDLAPTLASLLGVSASFAGKFVGKDFSNLFNDGNSAVQQYVHFTYDDNHHGIPESEPYFIRAIRSARWKYAVYFNEKGTGSDYEMFQLTTDPNEITNLAGNPHYRSDQAQLDSNLQAAMTHAGTTPSFGWPPGFVVGNGRGGPPPST